MVNKSSVKDKGDDPYIWTLSDISISNTLTETTSTVEDNTNDINTNKENISSLESRVTTLENNESSGS